MRHSKEVAVLDAAIEQIGKPNGFIKSMYLARDDGISLSTPGPDVAATCAIGGIEQGVWKVTGEAPLATIHRPSNRRDLFGRVVGKCDRIAREMFPNGINECEGIQDIEDVTFAARTEEAARKHVLRILRAARREYLAA